MWVWEFVGIRKKLFYESKVIVDVFVVIDDFVYFEESEREGERWFGFVVMSGIGLIDLNVVILFEWFRWIKSVMVGKRVEELVWEIVVKNCLILFCFGVGCWMVGSDWCRWLLWLISKFGLKLMKWGNDFW